MAVFMNAQLFTSLEDKHTKTAAQRGFANFKPPDRKALEEKWLPLCYVDVYKEALVV